MGKQRNVIAKYLPIEMTELSTAQGNLGNFHSCLAQGHVLHSTNRVPVVKLSVECLG